jgi:hypothetical protein
VCRDGGRIVLCDAFASDDPVKATAFNVMERHRDPSTVEFRTLSFLRALFAEARLPELMECFYKVPAELERLLAMAYPAGDDRAGLRAIIEAAWMATRWASAHGARAARCASSIRRWC